MIVQFFLIPIMVVGMSRGPSYLKWFPGNMDGLDVPWSCKDYGLIDTLMVCAVNADQVDLDWLAAQDGVFTFPQNIDVSPSPAEINALTDALEAAFIPADWITPADTWRTALRTVTGMFLFMQRLTTITGNTPFDWGVTLNTRFNQLDQVYQDAITEAYTTLGYDPSDIKTNWTLRVLLKNFADQWGETPIYFGFVTL